MAKVETFDIEYCDVVLFVTGIYVPEEKMVMYYPDGSGSPGYPAEFDIYDIKCGYQKIGELLSDDQKKDIEILILNNHYDHEY